MEVGVWALSSPGRALLWHRRGSRFESDRVHKKSPDVKSGREEKLDLVISAKIITGCSEEMSGIRVVKNIK